MKYISLLFIINLLVSCSNDKDSTSAVIQRLKNNEIPVFYKDKGLYGLKDKTGKIIIKPTYTEVGKFDFGAAIVKKGEKEGAINLLGEEAVPLGNHNVTQFPIRSSLEAPNFIFVHDIKDYLPRFFKDALGIKIKKDKEGLYNLGGKEILPIEYDDIMYRGEGYTVGIKGDSIFDYVDQNGNKVKKVSQQFNLHPFKDGIAAAGEKERFGFVDRNLEKVIDFKYERAKEFNNGLAAVRKDGFWGYINKQGKTVIPFVFNEAETFKGGVAMVKKDSFYGLVDKNGKLLTKFVYKSIRSDQPYQYYLEKDDVFTLVTYDSLSNQLVYDN